VNLATNELEVTVGNEFGFFRDGSQQTAFLYRPTSLAIDNENDVLYIGE
jgi:hypothetical protein